MAAIFSSASAETIIPVGQHSQSYRKDDGDRQTGDGPSHVSREVSKDWDHNTKHDVDDDPQGVFFKTQLMIMEKVRVKLQRMETEVKNEQKKQMMMHNGKAQVHAQMGMGLSSSFPTELIPYDIEKEKEKENGLEKSKSAENRSENTITMANVVVNATNRNMAIQTTTSRPALDPSPVVVIDTQEAVVAVTAPPPPPTTTTITTTTTTTTTTAAAAAPVAVVATTSDTTGTSTSISRNVVDTGGALATFEDLGPYGLLELSFIAQSVVKPNSKHPLTKLVIQVYHERARGTAAGGSVRVMAMGTQNKTHHKTAVKRNQSIKNILAPVLSSSSTDIDTVPSATVSPGAGETLLLQTKPAKGTHLLVFADRLKLDRVALRQIGSDRLRIHVYTNGVVAQKNLLAVAKFTLTEIFDTLEKQVVLPLMSPVAAASEMYNNKQSGAVGVGASYERSASAGNLNGNAIDIHNIMMATTDSTATTLSQDSQPSFGLTSSKHSAAACIDGFITVAASVLDVKWPREQKKVHIAVGLQEADSNRFFLIIERERTGLPLLAASDNVILEEKTRANTISNSTTTITMAMTTATSTSTTLTSNLDEMENALNKENHHDQHDDKYQQRQQPVSVTVGRGNTVAQKQSATPQENNQSHLSKNADLPGASTLPKSLVSQPVTVDSVVVDAIPVEPTELVDVDTSQVFYSVTRVETCCQLKLTNENPTSCNILDTGPPDYPDRVIPVHRYKLSGPDPVASTPEKPDLVDLADLNECDSLEYFPAEYSEPSVINFVTIYASTYFGKSDISMFCRDLYLEDLTGGDLSTRFRINIVKESRTSSKIIFYGYFEVSLLSLLGSQHRQPVPFITADNMVCVDAVVFEDIDFRPSSDNPGQIFFTVALDKIELGGGIGMGIGRSQKKMSSSGSSSVGGPFRRRPRPRSSSSTAFSRESSSSAGGRNAGMSRSNSKSKLNWYMNECCNLSTPTMKETGNNSSGTKQVSFQLGGGVSVGVGMSTTGTGAGLGSFRGVGGVGTSTGSATTASASADALVYGGNCNSGKCESLSDHLLKTTSAPVPGVVGGVDSHRRSLASASSSSTPGGRLGRSRSKKLLRAESAKRLKPLFQMFDREPSDRDRDLSNTPTHVPHHYNNNNNDNNNNESSQHLVYPQPQSQSHSNTHIHTHTHTHSHPYRLPRADPLEDDSLFFSDHLPPHPTLSRESSRTHPSKRTSTIKDHRDKERENMRRSRQDKDKDKNKDPRTPNSSRGFRNSASFIGGDLNWEGPVRKLLSKITGKK